MLGLDAKVQMTAQCRLIYHLGRGCSLYLHPPHHHPAPASQQTSPHTHAPPSVSMEISGVCILPWRRRADCRLSVDHQAPFSQMEFWENTIFRWQRKTRTQGPHMLQHTHGHATTFRLACVADCINLITSRRHTASVTFIMLPCKLFSHAANQH